MINRSSLKFYLRGNLFCSRTKTKNPSEEGKFRSMWLGPYVMLKVLKKGAYELTYFEGNKFPEPTNGLYLKEYYA